MPAAMKSLVSSKDFAKAQAYQFDKLSFQLLGEYLGFADGHGVGLRLAILGLEPGSGGSTVAGQLK